MTLHPAPTQASALPEALAAHVGYLGVVLGQRSQAAFEEAIEALSLKPIHYDYLATLAELGAMSQRDLARVLEVDAARIVSLTDTLEERELVTRTVDPSDRRRNLLALTKAGRTLFTRAQRIASRVEDDLLSPLNVDERASLRRLLRKTLAL